MCRGPLIFNLAFRTDIFVLVDRNGIRLLCLLDRIEDEITPLLVNFC